MNRKQADNIINIIQKNVEIKTADLKNKFQKDEEITSVLVTENVENEFSLLGKIHGQIEKNVNIEKKIDEYVTANNITDSNIKHMASQYKSNIRSVDEFKKKLISCFYGNLKKFDKFIYYAYVSLESEQKNSTKIDTTPIALVENINFNRNLTNLSSLTQYTKQPILHDYFLDNNTQCEKNIDLNKLTQDINVFAKNYGSKFDVPSEKDGFIVVIQELYNLIYSQITKTKQLSTILSTSSAQFIKINEKSFDKLSPDVKNSIDDSFNNVLTLMLTNRTLALILKDKEQYIQISKIIRFDIANQLLNITNNYNSSVVSYILAEQVAEGFERIVNKLGYDMSQVNLALSTNGIKVNTTKAIYNFAEFVLAEQAETINNKNLVLARKYNIDYNKLQNEEHFTQLLNSYQKIFNKLLNERKFVLNTKIDINAETKKVTGINNDIVSLITFIKNEKKVTQDQLKSLLDSYAYALVSQKVLLDLSKQQFGIEIKDVVEGQETVELPAVEEKVEEVVPTQTVVEESPKKLIENDIVIDTQTPAIKTYKPNFVIIEEEKKNVVEFDATSNDTNVKHVEPEKVIEVEAEEHKEINNKNVVTNTEQEPKQGIKSNKNNTQTTASQKIQNQSTEQQEKVTKVVETKTKEQKSKKHYVAPVVTVEEQEQVKEKPQEKVAVIKTETNQPKVADTKVENKTEKPIKTETTTNIQTLVKEKKMNEDNQKLNAELEKQKQEIEMLKRQLAQAQKQNATKQVATVSKDEKVERLKDKIQIVLTNAFKKSASNLANKNLVADENNFINSILHFNKTSNDAQFMASSLNMLFVMGEGDTSVRNMFVAMNKAQVAKNLMKLKGNLEKVFVSDFAEKLAKNAVEYGESSFPAEVIVNKAIKIYCEKYVKELDYNRRKELDLVIQNYGEDSFEYEDAENIINKKYFGEDGLLTKLDNSRLALITQDIIISQINEIDYAEANNLPYVFGKDKIDSILDEIVGNHNCEETHTF